jgi:hypothetical protein
LIAGTFIPGIGTALGLILTGTGLILGGFAAQLELQKPELERRQLALRTRRDTGAPHPIVYGTSKVGTKNSILYLPLTLCHGSRDGQGIAEIRDVYLDGKHALDSDGEYVEGTQWSQYTLAFAKLGGTSTQNIGGTDIPNLAGEADKALYEVSGSTWNNTTDKGAGLAALLLRMRQRPSSVDDVGLAFPRGAPEVACIVKGNLVEDTRSEVAGVNITFNENAPFADTIVRASGSFSTDGYVAGDRVEVSGSGSNDGNYTITNVATSTLTISFLNDLADEGPVGGVTLKRWAHPDSGADNPAMCLRDYLLSDKYGPGYAATLIHEQSFKDAADYCDESVTVPAPITSQNRFTCNGWLDTGRTVKQNIEEILSSCRGNLVFELGQFRLYIRQVTTANADVELTAANIIGDWSFRSGGIADKYNTVRATFVDPTRNYKPVQTQWPRTSVSNTYLTEDNEFENVAELQLPLTNDQHTAQHICEAVLLETRQGITAQCRCTEEVLRLSVGDVVKVTHDTPAWDQKEFWIVEMSLLPDTTVQVTLAEYEPSVYTISTLDDQDTSPDTGLGDLFDVAPPTNVILDSGTLLDRVRVQWTEADDAFVDFYEVQGRHVDGDNTYRTFARVRGFETPEAFITSVRNGQTWQARVRTINQIDVASAWAESAQHVAQSHDNPEVALTLTPVANGVEIAVSDWDVDADGVDAVYAELYVRENATASGPNPFETPAYWVYRFLSGDTNAFLEPAADDRYVRCFAVPYNAWGERGILTATSEAQSGATGAGPTAPPSGIVVTNSNLREGVDTADVSDSATTRIEAGDSATDQADATDTATNVLNP